MHIYYYNGFLGDVSVNCCITELRCKEVINKARVLESLKNIQKQLQEIREEL